jgi:biotin operon repressor
MAKVSLQKFTQIKDEESLDLYMKENPGTEFKELFQYLTSKVNGIYKMASRDREWQKAAELLVYFTKIYGSSEEYENTRNSLYQWNHLAIIQALHKGVLTHNAMPTITNIAEETGLSRTSVHKHLKDIKEQGLESDVRMQQMALTEQAISTLYKIGMQDRNPTALKLFIQFSDPSTRVRTVNNYVQINNLRLSQEDVEALPSDVVETIESILSPFGRLKKVEK